jgi:hypothetical protein
VARDFDELGSAVFDDLHQRIVAVRTAASERLTSDVRGGIDEELTAEAIAA